MTVRCVCCDLPEVSCGRAAETRQRQQLAQWRQSLVDRGWILADYPGYCVQCGVGFTPGVAIRSRSQWHPGGVGGWVAECCAKGDL